MHSQVLLTFDHLTHSLRISTFTVFNPFFADGTSCDDLRTGTLFCLKPNGQAQGYDF